MLIKRLCTICLFVLSLCVNTAMAQHIESFNDVLFCSATTVQPMTMIGSIGTTEVSRSGHITAENTITQEDDRSVFDEKNGAYIFNALRRLKSVDHFAGMGVKPDFDLVFEFPVPSLLQSALSSTALPQLQSHWIGHIPPSHNRLSGWKEGNLLYSHRFG
ncbi:hypothetical protein [Photobacterium sp. DNB22_13_2]